ncbi:MAG: N-methyl-L-tryptophan oxidase, partial [Thermomicrobiales bacterium]
ERATMSGTTYDAIVVGLGAMGAGATYQLAKRGARVLGLDMFPLGHDQGSSHGHHRMIRRSAYRPEIEHMATRAFELWPALEAESGRNILNLIGEVSLFDPNAAPQQLRRRAHVVEEANGHAPSDIGSSPVAPSAFDFTMGGRRELLDERTLRDRFPGFHYHEGLIATYEATAGFLRPEVGVAAHLEVAARHGATIRRPETVTGWQPDGTGVVVTTDQGTYRADRLVLTAGPWSAELLAGLNLPLQVVRIVNAYFAPTRPDIWTSERGAPDFLLTVPEGSFYGMPSIEGVGLKIGRHDNGEQTTARTIRRDVDAAEVAYLRNVLDRYMPGASGPVTQVATCMYTMTPDEQYIIEPHAEHPQVIYGCGCSGTSYKFSGVIGDMLADLALTGFTTYDMAFISSNRFAAAAV